MGHDNGDDDPFGDGERTRANDWQLGDGGATERPPDGATMEGPPDGAATEGPPTEGAGPPPGADAASESDGGDVDPERAERFLDELLADETLQSSMQAGEYTAFRNRLREREGRTDDPDRLAAIEWALANPGEFAERIRKAPTLWTLNGIGTKVYGEDQFDSTTGYYLTTLYITFLWLPVFPLGRYLVRKFGEDYEFFAKTDLGSFHVWWRRLALFGFLAVAGAIAYGAATYQPEVRFINGLDHPVAISIDEETRIDVPARSMRAERLPAGEHTFSTRYVADETSGEGPSSEEALVEELDFQVPQYSDLVAYNVAGLAPAYIQSVTYFSPEAGTRQNSANQTPEVTPIAGRRRYVGDDVDYIAEEPPDEIPIPSGSNKAVRWEFRYDGEGVETSARILRRFAPDRLDPFLRSAIELQPDGEWYYADLRDRIRHAAHNDPEALGAWFDYLKRVAWNHPTAMPLHTFYVSQVAEYAGVVSRPDPVEAYRAHHRREGTAQSALMFAHVARTRQKSRSLLNSVVGEAPEGSELAVEAHGQLGALHAEDGDCETSLEHFEKSRRASETLGDHYLDLYAICLARSDNGRRARTLLRKYSDLDSPSAITHSTTFGRIVLETEASTDPFALFDTLASEWSDFRMSDDLRVMFANQMGLAFDEERLGRMELTELGKSHATMNRVLFRSPDEILTSYVDSPGLLESMDDGTKMFVALMAFRSGDEATVEAISSVIGASPAGFGETIRKKGSDFEFAEPAPDDWLPSERAAWYLARAAAASETESKREALGRVEETALVHGTLTRVAEAYRQNLE